MLWVRSGVFYALIYLTVVVHGLFGATIARLFSFNTRFAVVTSWNLAVLKLLDLICNIKYQVIGKENIPKNTPFVIMANHESTWETVVLQPMFPPLCTVLKKELLRIPFFGWALASLEPVAIDRNNPREAMKKVTEGGIACINKGRNLLIFPEGSRNPEKKSKKYARSGANIAIKAGVPVLPIAHNGASCWPHGFLKKPGIITLSIGKPIDTVNTDSRKVTEATQAWIEAEIERINKQ